MKYLGSQFTIFRLNGLMGEKDKRIQLGQKMDEPVAKQTCIILLSYRFSHNMLDREMLRTFYIHPKGNFLTIWKGFLQVMILFYVITYTQEYKTLIYFTYTLDCLSETTCMIQTLST